MRESCFIPSCMPGIKGLLKVLATSGAAIEDREDLSSCILRAAARNPAKVDNARRSEFTALAQRRPLMSRAILLQDNCDKRVELLQKYAYKFFPATKYMDYAVKVEAYTLGKAANLVLNVDGCIGALFLDLLNSSSQFTPVSSCQTHCH